LAENDEIVEDSVEETEPLPVKLVNTPVKDVKWNDSKDDIEYESLAVSEEDMDI